MSNLEIATLFRNVAAVLTIQNANRFRIVAYEKVADSIEKLTSDIKDLWKDGKLREIPGIGDTIASYIDELFKTGKIKHLEAIIKSVSPAFFIFLQIPGIGPKRADFLTSNLKISNPKTALNDLKKAIKSGKISKFAGWGEKSQSELTKSIASFERGHIKENRMPLPFADSIAMQVLEYLKKLPQVKQADVLGSLRRKVPTIGDIDLAVATNEPNVVIKAFVDYPKARKTVDQGEKGATILLFDGRQVDLRVQTPKAYGAMLQYFTGSKLHNIHLREFAIKKGLSLSEHGIKNITGLKIKDLRFKNFNDKSKIYEFDDEVKFYNALGLDWIPPELREDTGEIEAALRQAQGKQQGLPKLVNLNDIKGDLHIHSNYNLEPSHDLGLSTLEELIKQADLLHYEYIGISDHNPSISGHNQLQVVEILKKRREKFEHIFTSREKSVKNRVKIFIMLEIDIDPKGNLAIPDEAFAYIDAAIVSIHSNFKMNKTDMTKRILSGLRHAKAKIFGHPTGRLLGSREGYEADWNQIFDFCKKFNRAVEINSWPERLDLPDLLVREAVKKGVKLFIDTDSHEHLQMFNMQYGVSVARRGWAENKDILNTLSYNELEKWMKI